METKKLVHFDVIRGLAALVVVVCHVHTGFFRADGGIGFSDVIAWIIGPTHTFLFGEFAVYVFFVLSGFVLSLGYFQSFQVRRVMGLILKRWPRLLLPVLATSLMYWLFVQLGWMYHHEVVAITHSTWLVQFWNESYTWWDFLGKATYDLWVLNDQQFCMNINSCLWTMPIEFQYSYLLFLSLLFIRGYKTFLIYNLLVVFSLVYPDQKYYFFAFAIGLNIAYVSTQFKIELANWQSTVCVGVALVLATNVFGRFWGKELFYCVGAGAVLLSVAFNPIWASAISKRVLVFLGKISFSLYLIHLLVLGSLSSFLYVTMSTTWGIAYEWVYTLLFAFTLLISIGLAVIVYHYIEVPSLKWATRFSELVLSKRTSQ